RNEKLRSNILAPAQYPVGEQNQLRWPLGFQRSNKAGAHKVIESAILRQHNLSRCVFCGRIKIWGNSEKPCRNVVPELLALKTNSENVLPIYDSKAAEPIQRSANAARPGINCVPSI